MDPRDDDAWLDAFGDDDLADPALDDLDGAVERVLAGLDGLPARPVASRPLPRRWMLLALAAAVAGAVLVERAVHLGSRAEPSPVASAPAPQQLGPQRPVAAPSRVGGATPAPEAPGAGGQNHSAQPARPAAGSPEPSAVVAGAGAEAAPVQQGLVAARDARVTVDGDAAVLASGMLSYRHDATHEPGVGRVRLVDLPLEARPVGTAFRVVAREQVGAVHLTEGRVRLVHEDGTVVSELRPGQEVVAMPDLDGPLGVRIVDTSDLPLDSVRALVPFDCLCRPEDVVAAVASLRFAALNPNETQDSP